MPTFATCFIGLFPLLAPDEITGNAIDFISCLAKTPEEFLINAPFL